VDFLKSVTGKVVSGLVGVAVIAIGISWWRMDPATRNMLLTGTGRIFAWLGIVLIVPWATFFAVGWVARLESNLAGAALVAGYTLAEALLLGKLFHWSLPGPTAWTFFAVGTLTAGVYNLFTCDWIAEKV
jgi:hypothetical protein